MKRVIIEVQADVKQPNVDVLQEWFLAAAAYAFGNDVEVTVTARVEDAAPTEEGES